MLVRTEAHGNGVRGECSEQSRASTVQAITTLVVVALLVLIKEAAALAVVVNAPEKVYAGETAVIEVQLLGNQSNLSVTIYKDGEIVANTTRYEWVTSKNDSGSHLFRAVVNGSESYEEEFVVEVLRKQGKVVITQPGGESIRDSEITIKAETSFNAEACNYSLDDYEGRLNNVGGEWFKTILLNKDGIYNLTVSCEGEENASANKIFILDTTPPQIVRKEPNGSFSGNPVRLEVETNENAICRYGEERKPYAELSNAFSETGGTIHKQVLRIKEEGEATYYVACADRLGNAMKEAEELSFHVNLAPYARIKLEGPYKKSDILRPGTYQVKVEVSEPVVYAKLSYEFSNERKRVEVPLEGEGELWEGFITIPEDAPDDVGNFYFEAEDLTGLAGRDVVEGKMFIIDTQPPSLVDSFQAGMDGLDVKLEWYYSGEDADTFYVYRDTSPGVDELDKYAETPNPEFTDRDVLIGRTYYYRVAAVDKAGNVGPLSKERKVLVEPGAEEDFVSPEAVLKLNETEKILERYLMDVNLAVQRLGSEKDRAARDVIQALSLEGEARSAKSKIEAWIKEVEKLKVLGLKPEEVEKRVKVFLEGADSELARVASDVEVVASSREEQALLEEDLEELANEAVAGLKLSKEEKEAYLERSKELQASVKVSSEAIIARVSYLGRVKAEEVSLVKKKIISESPLREAVIVEKIPKSVAATVEELGFSEKPKVLRRDPVVKFEELDLTSKEYAYWVWKSAELTALKDAKTVVLEKPVLNNLVTANVAKEVASPQEGVARKLPLLLGLVMLAGLFIYYLNVKGSNERVIIHPYHFPQFQPLSIIQKRLLTSNAARKPAKPRIPKREDAGRKASPQVYEKLRKAHNLIESVRYEEALTIYKALLEGLRKEEKRISPEERKKLEAHLESLYSKLLLASHVKRAHKAVDARNLEALKESLAGMKKHYSKLRFESELARHVRENYSYFLLIKNSLEREEFFKKVSEEEG